VTKPNTENCKNCSSVLMTVHSFSTQYNTEQFWKSPFLPPDKHHSSDVVYRRRRGDTAHQWHKVHTYEYWTNHLFSASGGKIVFLHQFRPDIHDLETDRLPVYWTSERCQRL